MAAPAISSAVTKMINLSIILKCFLTLCILARVCPILKSGQVDEQLNYRPISILCMLSNILEKHGHNHLYAFITQYNLIHLA